MNSKINFISGLFLGLILGIVMSIPISIIFKSSVAIPEEETSYLSRIVRQNPLEEIDNPEPKTKALVEQSRVWTFAYCGEILEVKPKEELLLVGLDLKRTFTDPLENYLEKQFKIQDSTHRLSKNLETASFNWEDFHQGDKVFIYPENSVLMIYEEDIPAVRSIKKVDPEKFYPPGFHES